MNEISNYGELKVAVKDWLNRRDDATIQRIPFFINFAEKSFSRLARLPYYETQVTMVVGSVASGGHFDHIQIPPDFLSVKTLMVNDHAMTRVDNETMLRLNAREQSTPYHNSPYYFTRIGSRIITYPELQTGDFVQMIYNRDIPEMKQDTDCPYSLIIAPDVMLYLSLQHASVWLRDNEQEQFWAAKAQEAAQNVMVQLDEAEWAGSTLQVQMFEEAN